MVAVATKQTKIYIKTRHLSYSSPSFDRDLISLRRHRDHIEPRFLKLWLIISRSKYFRMKIPTSSYSSRQIMCESVERLAFHDQLHSEFRQISSIIDSRMLLSRRWHLQVFHGLWKFHLNVVFILIGIKIWILLISIVSHSLNVIRLANILFTLNTLRMSIQTFRCSGSTNE